MGGGNSKQEANEQISSAQWKMIINAAITEIFSAAGEPVVGKWVNTLMNFFWPSPGKPDVFETIRAQVEELVDTKIFEFELKLLQGDINGLQQSMQMYKDAKLHEKGVLLGAVLTQSNGVFSKIRISDHRRHLVPVMVTLGMIQLTMLKERSTFGKDLYDEDNQKQWDKELKREVELYERTLKQMYLEWKVWRNDKIITSSRPSKTPPMPAGDSAHGSVQDTLTGKSVSWEDWGNMTDVFAPDVILQKQSWFSVSNAEYFCIYSKSFNFHKFLPNQEQNPPNIPLEFETLDVGPLNWTSTDIAYGRPRNLTDYWDQPGGDVAGIVIREYNNIDGLQIKYTDHDGKFVGSPTGGVEHLHTQSIKKRLTAVGLGFNNRGLVELTLTDSDGKKETEENGKLIGHLSSFQTLKVTCSTMWLCSQTETAHGATLLLLFSSNSKLLIRCSKDNLSLMKPGTFMYIYITMMEH
jgi:hypothetical protein